MDSVLEVLRARAAVPRRARDEAEWLELIRISGEQRVLPFVASILREHGEALPPTVRTALDAVWRDAMHSSFLWTAELKGLLQAFAAAFIPVIPLKGPALAERLYGGAVLRPCRDLDLLVRLGDFDRATALLQTLGFTAISMKEEYEQPFLRGTTKVELHFDLEDQREFHFDTASAWERSEDGDFAGVPMKTLNAVDEFHYLCLHGVRHRYERLGHVLDVELARRRLPDRLASTFSGLHPEIRPVVALGHAMSDRLMGRSPGERKVAGAEVCPGHLELQADKLWSRLLEQREPASGWIAQHRFYRELESTRQGRRRRAVRQIGILATRLIATDYAFAARFGVRRPWGVRLLRLLRLIPRVLGLAAKGKLP